MGFKRCQRVNAGSADDSLVCQTMRPLLDYEGFIADSLRRPRVSRALMRNTALHALLYVRTRWIRKGALHQSFDRFCTPLAGCATDVIGAVDGDTVLGVVANVSRFGLGLSNSRDGRRGIVFMPDTVWTAEPDEELSSCKRCHLMAGANVWPANL